MGWNDRALTRTLVMGAMWKRSTNHDLYSATGMGTTLSIATVLFLILVIAEILRISGGWVYQHSMSAMDQERPYTVVLRTSVMVGKRKFAPAAVISSVGFERKFHRR